MTLVGGKGDDTFSRYYGICNVYAYKKGDGNDVIEDFNEDDTILITGGSWTKSTVGSDVLIMVGNGAIVLKDAASLSSINITSSAKDISPINLVENTQSNALITGTNYRDSIYNSGDNVTINAGKGNDYISMNDNDINANATKVVLNYAVGDGNDTVYKCNPSDRINLTGGSVKNISISGNDLILNTGKGSIRFVNTNAVNVNGKIYGNIGTSTSGDDLITNFADKAKINGKGGDDTISNGGENVSINTGDGANTVKNYGSNTTIQAGSGVNHIHNCASATVQGTAGNDSLRIEGEKVNLNTGAGNDSIMNLSYSVSIDAGTGDDSVYNDGNYSLIKLGDGNDSLESWDSYTTIDGGKGNDTIISVNGAYKSISGGAGNDRISLETSQGAITVNAGTGNDTIYGDTSGNNYAVLYQYRAGDGNDVIENFKENDTLSIVDTGDFSTLERGLDVIVTVGKGSVTLKNAANLDKLNVVSKIIKLTGDKVEFDNNVDGATVSSFDGNDIIYNNQADSVSINSGAGNDSLKNYYGDSVTIEAGKGNDSIFNEVGHNSKINAGDGNDSVDNWNGNNVSIKAGAGNDYVYSYGINATMNGGKGNDTVDSYDGVGNVYVYRSGDGNDIIVGFNEDDTILITDGSWTKATVGSDIVLTVGAGKITLNGAASLSAVNITSSVTDIHPVNLVENYQSDTLITGISYRDSVYNSSFNVTINTGDGNDSVKNFGSSVKINTGAGNDYIDNYGDTVTIDAGAGNDTIENGNVWSRGGSAVTINGGKGNDEIILGYNVTKNVIKYAVGDGNDTVYNYNPSNKVELTGGAVKSASISGNDLILKTSKGSILFVDTHAVNVNDKIYGNVNTTGTSGDDVITNFADKAKINGKGGNDLIQNGGANVSINTGDGYNTVMNYGANTTIQVGSGENDIYNYASATVQGNAGNDTLNLRGETITLNAGAGNDFIDNMAESVSIDAGAGDDSVYNSNNYSQIKLGDGNDSIENNSYNVTIDGGAGKDTISGYYYHSSIDGGAGNDHISLMGTNFYGNTVKCRQGQRYHLQRRKQRNLVPIRQGRRQRFDLQRLAE